MPYFFFILSLFFLNHALAIPVGNPYNPGILGKGLLIPSDNWINFRVEYLGNFVTDRRLMQAARGAGKVDCFSQYTNSGSLTLNIKERVDIYGTCGVGNISGKWRVKNLGVTSWVKAKSNSHYTWTIGTNIILLEWKKTCLGFNISYMEMEPALKLLTIDNVLGNVSNAGFHYHEWQGAIGVARRIKFLIPYIGIQYTSVECIVDSPYTPSIAPNYSTTNHFKSKNHAGVYLGCAISNGNIFFLNIEARLVDEEAMTVTADFRF